MKTETKRKFIFSKEDISELYPFLKKVFKISLTIILIKYIRLLFINNNQANNFIHQMFAIAETEKVFKFFSFNLLVIGILGLFIGYLIQGKIFIRNKLFGFLFFFCFIDALFIYIFPEIPASVAKAIFLQ